MKNFSTHFRNRVIAGVIFLLPILAVLKSIKNLWAKMSSSGSFIVELLGLKAILGSAAIPVVNTLLLLLLFYIFGYLVRVSILNRFRDWLENSVLKYVPGYLTVKAQILSKVTKGKDTRLPAMVQTGLGERYGLLVEEKGGQAIIFFPNCPDTNNGQLGKANMAEVTLVDLPVGDFLKKIQQFGKGFL